MELKDTKNSVEKLILQIEGSSYSDETLFQAFQILQKILQNILNNPTEEKFKHIKKTNATLQKSLFCIKEMEALLELLDFTHSGDHLVFTGTHLQEIQNAVNFIHNHAERIRNRHLTESEREELEKERLLEERRREFEHDQRVREEEIKKLKELMECDKREQAQREKVGDSHAAHLEFGAHTVTWHDIQAHQNVQQTG